jgi:hypothetical protein
MDRFLKKGQDICREKFNPVLVKEVCSYLPVVEPVHPELEYLGCKLFLRASAERGVTAVAPQEFIEKSKDLVPDTIVQSIVVDPGAEGLEHVSRKCQFGKAISGKSF